MDDGVGDTLVPIGATSGVHIDVSITRLWTARNKSDSAQQVAWEWGCRRRSIIDAHAMFQAKGIDPRTREMIILRAAKVLNAPYELQANVVMAKNAGLVLLWRLMLPPRMVRYLERINPEYVLVCKATDELSKERGTLRDETLRELLRYGETVSRKIVLMIGWFNMLSLFLNGCRVPLETTGKVGTRTSPLG